MSTNLPHLWVKNAHFFVCFFLLSFTIHPKVYILLHEIKTSEGGTLVIY